MSDTKQKTDWLPIIKDMCILVAIMGALGYACNLAMKPFESVQVTDSLVSLIRKVLLGFIIIAIAQLILRTTKKPFTG